MLLLAAIIVLLIQKRDIVKANETGISSDASEKRISNIQYERTIQTQDPVLVVVRVELEAH